MPQLSVAEKAAGADQTFAAKSGCVESMPVSITPTTFAVEPVEIFQAAVALMSIPGEVEFKNDHCCEKLGSLGVVIALRT